jgi:hypothetical protein
MRAVTSCLHQTNQSFDLIIVDDASTDESTNYLCSIQHHPQVTALILNHANLGFSASINLALKMVQTEWATILCDDDYLDPHFVDASLATLARTDKACVVTSFNHVDPNQQVVQAYAQQSTSLDASQALAAQIPIAGISGFFFRIGARTARDLMRDYPRAFFSDTLFALEFILPTGLETVAPAWYNKTVWDQSESALNAQSALHFFEAMLRYQQDLEPLLNRHNVPAALAAQLRKPMSLGHFFRVLLLPILARGALTKPEIDKWFALAYQYDTRYLPHCRMVALTRLVANHATLTPRRYAHRVYRRWLARRA